ncbi:ATP-binding protein [Streptomyces sp. 35G-GA-8]|uniref:ATP-binding protein n=1 Tax=Streptomyces sp. 35G-GA-8 TaxID=2939434 RepID=UPI00201EE141|nr:ATP-binding protein [Streptomyces sp. 35G-GA-8]MCL7382525.1 putative DNA binding domain-containing protein [Streptomyces sp. 35G-GA-8]
MARSWTRLHEHLGAAPGPLDFGMVRQAAADALEESDDLDWKEQLPHPPRDGWFNGLAKDVVAMANPRCGLLIFGVRDKTCELVGIDPEQVNDQQYSQWIRKHVQPYLPDITFTTLTSPDGSISVLVIDIPASPMAPHHVYGTAQKDKEQHAAVVPYRDKDHTAWMAEHQIERAYRDRFTRTERAEQEVQNLLDQTRETVFAQQAEPSAWFFALARPERPLPRTPPASPATKPATSCTPPEPAPRPRTARVRSRHHLDPALETPAETQARSALEELERRYLEAKTRLENELQRARQEAEPVRAGLLYGSGSELEDAVAVVLRAAGFAVTDLGEELGDTLSADLLACAERVYLSGRGEGRRRGSGGETDLAASSPSGEMATGAARPSCHLRCLDRQPPASPRPCQAPGRGVSAQGRRRTPVSRDRLRRPVPLVAHAGLVGRVGRRARPGLLRGRMGRALCRRARDPGGRPQAVASLGERRNRVAVAAVISSATCPQSTRGGGQAAVGSIYRSGLVRENRY